MPSPVPQAETAQAETAQAETAQAETAQAKTAQAEMPSTRGHPCLRLKMPKSQGALDHQCPMSKTPKLIVVSVVVTGLLYYVA